MYMYVYIYIYICACIYIYIYIYTHTYPDGLQSAESGGRGQPLPPARRANRIKYIINSEYK